MSQPLRRTTGLVAVTAVALGLGAALPTAARADVSPAAASEAATIVSNAAYRGAEHEFLVSNVAFARQKFGKGSAQDKAATAVLATNATALATLITTNAPSQAASVASLLTQRDNAELAYAAASLARHKKAKGAAAKQEQTLQTLAADETTIGTALAALFPDTKAADNAATLKLVDTADEAALEAQSRTGVDRFAKFGLASTLLSALTSAIAADAVTVGKVPGDLNDPHALARIAGAVVATQHVYSVGQFILTGLLTGTQSGQTKAAEAAVNTNTADVAKLLGAEGLNQSLVQSAWAGHINGYRLFTAFITTRHAFDKRQANVWLTGYENTLANEIALKIPALPAALIKPGIVEHVAGTQQIAKDLSTGNPRVFGEASMGAQHLVDVFGQLAENAPVTKASLDTLAAAHIARL